MKLLCVSALFSSLVLHVCAEKETDKRFPFSNCPLQLEGTVTGWATRGSVNVSTTGTKTLMIDAGAHHLVIREEATVHATPAHTFKIGMEFRGKDLVMWTQGVEKCTITPIANKPETFVDAQPAGIEGDADVFKAKLELPGPAASADVTWYVENGKVAKITQSSPSPGGTSFELFTVTTQSTPSSSWDPQTPPAEWKCPPGTLVV